MATVMMRLSLLLSLLAWCQAAVVPFEITLTWDTVAPDGVPRKAILSNGQLPGPPLYLDQGDEVEFLVHNELPFSTAVHFHGIEQLDTPWSDGVPGLSQRPIQPGDSFLYKWKATQYGSYFYHAHKSGQINDGLYGAIIIRPSPHVPRPFHLITNDSHELEAIQTAELQTKPIILSDWTHHTSNETWNIEEAAGLDAYCTNSILINGQGSVTCLPQAVIDANANPAVIQLLNGSTHLTDMGCIPPTLSLAQGPYPHNFSAVPPGVFWGCKPSQGPTEVLEVNPEVEYVSWELISAAGVSTFVFSIDEHPMWVYAVDGRYVTPTRVDALTISNGQRFSILVKLDKPPANYNVRTVVTGLNQLLNATAILSYANSPEPPGTWAPSAPSITLNGLNATANTTFWNESLAVPFPPVAPAPFANETYVLRLNRWNASYRWYLGNDSFPLSLQYDKPLLFDPNAQGPHSDLTVRTQNGSWVDIIFHAVKPLQPTHPFHKHSTKFFVIGAGVGPWNYSSVEEAMRHIPQNFNLVNPPIRDTYSTPASLDGESWLAVRYQVVNPGAFLLHCHIQVHLDGGMALALLDGIDKWPVVPDDYLNGNGL
ncbi:laccase [Rasamsonia emersonii CBS 393.64]|uniref:Laccase n=1 Tax=Rasamsonia emersonii (strain ATCC 16479 / CBS 393.64 / IMI 116815) TaxID=1408163 RepID=A0A0F4YNH6_RASE3|nr:laccase [Rasamsonia emersonii CBS 393.64]KKA19822.1 laccase [Rasamsonia emersonii CBS 393.64]